MRKFLILFILLTALFFASLFISGVSQSSVRKFNSKVGDVTVYFFYGQGCPHCARVEPFISEMEGVYGLDVRRFEVYGNRSNMMVLQDYFERYGVPASETGIPVVFTSESYLVGDVNILDGFERLIWGSSKDSSVHSRVVSGSVDDEAYDAVESSRLDCLSLLTITVAALVDAINPCSMAILFFLMAGLLLLKKRGRALKIGLAFALSVFVANLLFGFGILTTIAVSSFSSVFKVAAGLVAVLTGVLLIKDCFFYGGGGFVMEVPRFLRPYLKRRLNKAFFGRNSGPIGAFLVGFLVSCFEVPCTGGPYFYVLARMADDATRMQTLPMLIYYNLIFVMPLVLITVLLYFGSVHVEKAREWKDRNKRFINLARGLPMIVVGLVTLPTSQTVQALTTILSIYKMFFIPLMAILAFYIGYSTFSKQKNRNKALRGIIIVSLTATIIATTLTDNSIVLFSLIGIGVAQGDLVITVLDSSCSPVKGADVLVYYSGKEVCNAPTNSSGMLTCSISDPPWTCPGSYDVVVYIGGVEKYNAPESVDETCAGSLMIRDTEKCSAGYCADGYCCDSACDGLCERCDGLYDSGTAGTCGNIGSGQDPDGECPAVACDGDYCDGSGNCQDITAETGYLCTDDCYDCVSGTCVAMTEDDDGSCNSDCDSCVDGTCVNRNQCDATECPSGWYCDVGGGSCIDPNENSQAGENVCEACVPGQHSYTEGWLFEPLTTPCCCENDANEYYVDVGVGAPACCDDPAENCVDAGGVCRDEYPNEVTCNDGIDNDCDGYVDGDDLDCDITPPLITILSPQNTTYTNNVSLTFTVYDYSPIDWMGYSLDSQANATITGNTTLTDLTYDSHNIVVYANDTYGNMGTSEKIYFTVKRQYTLTIQTTTGGTTDPPPGSYDYTEGTVVTVTAIPDADYEFDYWILDDTTYTTNPINVTMNTDHTLTAYFTELELIHDIAITNITFSNPNPSINEIIHIYVTVENRGNLTETFDVSVNYTRIIDPLIETQTITLAPGETITLNFTWTPQSSGRYEIKAYTSEIPDDINPEDNTKTSYLYVTSGSSGGGGGGGGRWVICMW